MSETVIEYQNGNVQEVAPAQPLGPQIQRRLETMRLPEPYDGFEFVAWANAPASLWQKILAPPQGATDELVEIELEPLTLDMATRDEIKEAEARVIARQERALMKALGTLIVSHNGWVDYDGTPLPPPSEPAFYEQIPTELLGAMIALMQENQKKLPGSLRKKRRR